MIRDIIAALGFILGIVAIAVGVVWLMLLTFGLFAAVFGVDAWRAVKP